MTGNIAESNFNYVNSVQLHVTLALQNKLICIISELLAAFGGVRPQIFGKVPSGLGKHNLFFALDFVP